MSLLKAFIKNSVPTHATATSGEWYSILNLEFAFTYDTRIQTNDPFVPLIPDDTAFTDCWRNHRVFLNLIDCENPAQWLDNCVARAYDSKTLSVCIVPLRLGAAWWAPYAARATEIRYPLARLAHAMNQNGSSHKIAIFIFRPRS